MLTRLLCLGTVAVACALALGQDAVFLVPESSVLTTRNAPLSIRSGSAAAIPLSTFPVRWAFVKTGEVQENRDSLAEWTAPSGSLIVPVPAPGGVMVGIDFAPRVESFSVSELRRLSAFPIASGSPSVAVRQYRSAVALLRTAWNGDWDTAGQQVPTSETSITCGIHAILDPTRPTGGGDLAFEVTVMGVEVEGVKLVATNTDTGTTTVLRTGEGTAAHLKAPPPGKYRLSFELLLPLKADPEAAFELFSGTMTFEIPASKGGGR